MLFCPRCSNLLLLGQNGQEMRFVCQTCPYYHAITQKMFKTMALDRKEVAEVESEKDWTNEDSDALCPNCRKKGAWYYEQQTRSADEPSTIFFKCKNTACKHQWKLG